MELELYDAFLSAGISEAKAKAAVESINKEIDKRYTLHAEKLATRGDISEFRSTLKSDLAEMELRLIKMISDNHKWTIGAMIACATLVIAILRMTPQ